MEREGVRDDPGEDRATGRTGCSAEPDNCADAGGREHVGGRGEEIGGPTLMGGGSKAEQSDSGPGVVGEQSVHVGHKHDGHNADGADKQSEFAAGVDAVAMFHAEAGEPSAGDRADAGCGVDDDEWIFDVVEVEAVVVVEELREIEEVEPPDGVGDAFRDEKGPETMMAEKDRVDGATLGDRG